MSKRDKLLIELGTPSHDWKNSYDEVKRLLLHFGYTIRSRGGSHVKFIREGMRRPLTLTEDKKGMITRYQSQQVREELKIRGFI